jgi:hypothetical protein
VLEHIRVHDTFPNALKTRLNWSKNVEDERDAPWQIVLGAMNPVYCVLCSLGLWLETNLTNNPFAMASPYVFAFSEDITVPKGGQKAKDIAQVIFGQKVFPGPQFVDDENGPLGSHSIRKYAATHARRCGVTKDEKDIRGRWKGKGRVSDVYDDVELPYPDAKVAEKLCIGGPCYYIWSDGLNSAMMSTFVLTHVVPNLWKRVPDSTALVLGKALLWMLYSPALVPLVPEHYRDMVIMELDLALGDERPAVEDGVAWSPIQKVPVVVSGDNGSVYIDEILLGGLTGVGGEAQQQFAGAADNSAGGGGTSIRNQLLSIQSSLHSLRRENDELRAQLSGFVVTTDRSFSVVNGNIRRVALQPARRIAAAPGVGGVDGDADGTVPSAAVAATAAAAAALAMMNNASLMPTPRNLHDLWHEHVHGIGGRKAARLFTSTE